MFSGFYDFNGDTWPLSLVPPLAPSFIYFMKPIWQIIMFIIIMFFFVIIPRSQWACLPGCPRTCGRRCSQHPSISPTTAQRFSSIDQVSCQIPLTRPQPVTQHPHSSPQSKQCQWWVPVKAGHPAWIRYTLYSPP